jgi:hypothetical protein
MVSISISVIAFVVGSFCDSVTSISGAKRHSSVWPCRDVVDSHDSIAVVLYHAEKNSMLLVRQFRPALYASLMRAAAKEGKSCNIPLARGFTCELCAGLVDKEKAIKEIVQEEILEECGYNVPIDSIQPIASYAAGVGIQGVLCHARTPETTCILHLSAAHSSGWMADLLL